MVTVRWFTERFAYKIVPMITAYRHQRGVHIMSLGSHLSSLPRTIFKTDDWPCSPAAAVAAAAAADAAATLQLPATNTHTELPPH
ncbi:unnamed protein product [Anisakis simplex]|uniref:Uncharacterized protein n=1 Tax=Anisakis simplex TaxID=6269 RepID=A0A0M3JFW8_ANISI|nr:unnamed protein product [Anisakis simplex]